MTGSPSAHPPPSNFSEPRNLRPWLAPETTSTTKLSPSFPPSPAAEIRVTGSPSAAAPPPPPYVGWEEVMLAKEKGKRAVHFFLRDAGGGKDLAVVGHEKSVRHMSYASPAGFLSFLRSRLSAAAASGSPRGSFPWLFSSAACLRWRSRREVIDWLSEVVSGPRTSRSPIVDRFSNDDASFEDAVASKDLSSGKMAHNPKEFSWLGCAWNCRKRRKHYPSFCRNGVTISVHEFVYILSEKFKRLIAYVEDLFEDTRGMKLVNVQWFHQADESGIVFPPDVSDREIFFSPCLQELKIECIDGLAAILSPQDYVKFQNEGRDGSWQPYMCSRKIDNDVVIPFDITKVQGYWSQGLLRSMYSSSLKLRLKMNNARCGSDSYRNGDTVLMGLDKNNKSNRTHKSLSSISKKVFGTKNVRISVEGQGHATSDIFFEKDCLKKTLLKQISPGCQVEVLSQDSGIRGCWFRCAVIKRLQDKVKVRYQDIFDCDEKRNLVEWVSVSRIVNPDKLGIRMNGRPVVRPCPSTSLGPFSIGSIVDVWWCDGWWEGVIIDKTFEQDVRVYFPGEERASIFPLDNLRHAQDWVFGKWTSIEDRPDVVSSVILDVGDANQPLLASSAGKNSPPPECGVLFDVIADQGVPKLAKDSIMLDSLNWSSFKKRRRENKSSRYASHDHKRMYDGCSSSSLDEKKEHSSCGLFNLSECLVADHEDCKVRDDNMFIPPLTFSSLVVSR